MSANVPMRLPDCPVPAHGPMELNEPGTPEQKWCGVWYRCRTCKSSVLFPSPELQAKSVLAQVNE